MWLIDFVYINIGVKMKHKKLVTAISGFIGMSVFGISASQAGNTITVDSISDQSEPGFTTLREAVEDSNTISGAVIKFDEAVFAESKTITLEQGELLISSSTTIDGPGKDLLTIDANNQSRVFTIEDSTSDSQAVYISGLTLTGGNGNSATADGRGGCVLNRESLTVNQTIITGCIASGAGGGLWSLGGDLTINESTITENFAGRKGGGLYLRSATFEINNTTISNNRSDEGGGIYWERNVNAILNNSTLSGNKADFDGDGMFCESGNQEIEINNSTIVNNKKSGVFGCNRIDVRNSIIANHTEADCEFGEDTSNVAFSHSIDTDLSCEINAINHTTVTDPMLEPLANFGGLTLTHRPLPGSSVIDSGYNLLCTEFDQRGEVRPQDSDQDDSAVCDIGAVELAVEEEVPQDAIYKDGFDQINCSLGTQNTELNRGCR